MYKIIISIIALLTIVLLGGCTIPMVNVPVNSQAIYTQVKKGDTVKVVQKNGQSSKFEVLAVKNQQLIGKKQAVSFNHIQSLQKEKLGTDKQYLAAKGLGYAYGAALMITFISVGIAAFG